MPAPLFTTRLLALYGIPLPRMFTTFRPVRWKMGLPKEHGTVVVLAVPIAEVEGGSAPGGAGHSSAG